MNIPPGEFQGGDADLMARLELRIHLCVNQVPWIIVCSRSKGKSEEIMEVCREGLERRLVSHETMNIDQKKRASRVSTGRRGVGNQGSLRGTSRIM